MFHAPPRRFSRIALAALLLTGVLAPAAAAATAPLVDARATWKYLDNGSNQGTAWRERGFDDSAWASGPAELGYGDGDEATVVGWGPDATNRYITTYFRHSFNLDDPSTVGTLTMRLIRDDGAVVYLNGLEIWRLNMPSGPISHTTLASTALSGTAETTWQQINIDAAYLVAGTNVIAVEMHQAGASSSDKSFALELTGATDLPPTVVRGPYLQSGTATSVVVRWRTDIASDSRVRFGPSPGNLTLFADNPRRTTEHEVTLTGLSPFTRYYYSVGTASTPIAGDDETHTFVTAPETGRAVATRIWVLGDSGTGGSGAAAVRNAYYRFAGPTVTNLWLMLGDNAYDHGTDSDYQKAVFNMYPEMLRSAVLWPAIGNHETPNEQPHAPPDLPYFQMFTLPTRAEAGGVSSGTEQYYSFDYGDIHFICLDSMTSDRSANGPMLTWLRNDLASTSQRWIIAFWHHPPYSKGSHDSDTSIPLIEMRQNAVPILEDAGVDLILAGHSHSYERSYLIDGHYGYSNSFASSMKRDGGDGRREGTGVYRKPGESTHEGAVYVVAGSSAVITGGALNHPAMFISLNNLGSMVLEVREERLDVKFLRETGAVDDYFTIVKGPAPAPPAAASSANAAATSPNAIALTWADNSTNEDGFRIERCTGEECSDFVEIAQKPAGTTSFSDTGLTPATSYRYRVIAYNAEGSAAPSNIAMATTQPEPPAAPSSLVATAVSYSRIDLTWTDGSTNEEGFRVERCSGAGCAGFAPIATLPAGTTAYSSSGLSPSTLYRYRVVAFNSGGGTPSNEADATTMSCTAVNITRQPSAVTIFAGQTARLSVSATGTTPLAYQWYRGASGETASPVSGATSPTLSIVLTSTTSLWARVTNGCSSVDSAAATVTVNPVPPTPTEAQSAEDFDGDGRADVFWRYYVTGRNTLWLMNGTTRIAADTPRITDLNWKTAAIGDFDGNGRADIFWRNSSTGQTTLWLMNGPNLLSATAQATVPRTQHVAGAGDFDGDGRDDLFWRDSSSGVNTIWLMNGASATVVSTMMADSRWIASAFGDFNGDGRDDVLWRHKISGAAYVWLMTRDKAKSIAVRTVDNLHWTPRGAADVNGDGRADVLWRNEATGANVIWFMDGAVVTSDASLPTLPAPWHPSAIGDFNATGTADILWRHPDTGETRVWLVSGARVLTSGSVVAVKEAAWQIEPVK